MHLQLATEPTSRSENPQDPQASYTSSSIHLFNLQPSVRQDDVAILEPYTYLVQAPGKDIRTTMILAFNSWLNVPGRKLLLISNVVSTLHNASLLIDDIEDSSDLRRGRTAAHIKYGIPKTINAACYIYFLAYQELLEILNYPNTDNPMNSSPAHSDNIIHHPQHSQQRIYSDRDLPGIVTDELLDLHRGQGMEMIWRDSLQCPTEAEYLVMISNKTGGLFRLAIKLSMAYSTTNVNVDYIPLVNLLGEYFQVRDDYMNLDSSKYTESKGFAEDLTEGKFSHPIIHGICADESDRTLIDILEQRPTSPTLKVQAITYLKLQTKSFEYTHGVLRKLESEIMTTIEQLGGNERLSTLLESLRVPSLND
ncbi:terpenoid synthase [Stereum hirsutum FP-91666 SS1]|uniref:terpenoid synthase n=1 Tax=Stereum hirsutum (strain FP-91666) TaxID=721885 RepID=UPI000444A819|nr:terpenoid synthase [Stereum hirsutum FP-91666 SS1]EIM86240.1 terpenoid synthase [Stereum hirsutum FP-91666 SS1]